MAQKKNNNKSIEHLKHGEASRKNIPSAEYQSMISDEVKAPVEVAYARRNRDLDPQLVWRGKDEQDWSDLVIQAPPLYIQEKIRPKTLIDDLKRQTESGKKETELQGELFADFNGSSDEQTETDFYQHDKNWTNRMILGDSLKVMASLAEREGLRGQVQCIYIDPPYGIKFNSNFQWSTTSRDVKDGKAEHISREPEQVKAFRDTWRDGIHSYLTYLRDRLTVARDLLTNSGSVFVQIGDENVHRVRALLDEIFGDKNFISEIVISKTGSQTGNLIGNISDFVLWYAKDITTVKYRQLFKEREYRDKESFSPDPLKSSGNTSGINDVFFFEGHEYDSGKNDHWKTDRGGRIRLAKANRVIRQKTTIRYKRYFQDFPVKAMYNIWTDLGGATNMVYVVQTATRLIERLLLLATDPGDLVIDPTCGSGTTAFVAEQWGRRWITIDTSRVAMALARARLMGAKYPFYLLANSKEGQKKEAEISRKAPSNTPVFQDIRHGFVYERVPHITLKSIANNTEIDVIWDRFQKKLAPLREQLNKVLDRQWEEWEIPREMEEHWSQDAKKIHAQWWELRIARQKEIDKSIEVNADQEYLYDRPYEDKKKVRVAGPFTVESLSPHRTLDVDENDEVIDKSGEGEDVYGQERGFTEIILENLKTSGVQQAHKEDKISFTELSPWPGDLICAEGRYIKSTAEQEGSTEKKAAVFIGPEFGTVSRPDLVEAAREAVDAGFDILISCAFSYDAHASEFNKLGRIPVLKAHMNADLHMAEDLKNTGKGNLFVIFGEPDIDILNTDDNHLKVQVNGVDVFHPNTGEIRSDNTDGIACWFIDTDYNEESFFVRHAYFLGAGDPYKSLRNTLKAEIDQEAWERLYGNVSRPFEKPQSGRIAVKVINHLGDEVMKVFKV